MISAASRKKIASIPPKVRVLGEPVLRALTTYSPLL